MEICHQDADFTLGREVSAISCRVGVRLIRGVIFSIIAFQHSSCAICAL